MQSITSRTALPTAAAVLICVGYATPAPGIDCNGPWQTVDGQQIATPYCEDNYLGQIARASGLRVSNVEIRQNPNKKGEVCRSFVTSAGTISTKIAGIDRGAATAGER
jgi:hypothetical protein